MKVLGAAGNTLGKTSLLVDLLASRKTVGFVPADWRLVWLHCYPVCHHFGTASPLLSHNGTEGEQQALARVLQGPRNGA